MKVAMAVVAWNVFWFDQAGQLEIRMIAIVVQDGFLLGCEQTDVQIELKNGRTTEYCEIRAFLDLFGFFCEISSFTT